MKAVLVKQPGGTEQLYLGEAPAPVPGPGELLLRVRATALNRADILQRRGLYPPPPGASEILGLECAGIVEGLGPGVRQHQLGDRVCGLLPGGGYAEYATLPAGLAIRIPENLSFAEAAAIPEAFLTAYQALVWLGEVKAGDRVLIHAGASGVGTAAIQLARELGCEVGVTAGSAAKLAACARLGAGWGANYKEEDFAAVAAKQTGGAGVSVIIDFIGAAHWPRNMAALAPDGRLVILALMGGRMLQEVDLSVLMKKRLRIIGSTLRGRTPDYKARLTAALAAFALPRFADGRLKAVIDCVMPLEEVARAHQRMEANENIGKIILSMA